MGKSKKKRTVKKAAEITDDSVPRSFIFHRGEVGKLIMKLITDMRHLMAPYTATNLKVNRNNVLKDFVHVAGPYGISHFIILSQTELSPYMKICRLPRGPTLTFKIDEYSLMSDVVSILKRPKTIGSQFKNPPLVVLNNFGAEALEIKLMTTVFQNMFPAIKVQKVKLSEIRRCAMFNYDSSTKSIDFRHYNIEAVPVGISRGVKKLLRNKIPNLGGLNDISDLVTGAAYLSESEGEEPTESHVTLPQRVCGRGNMKAGQSAVRLTEMGPRLKMSLIKIEEGVCDGEVLYHKYVEKSEKDKKELKKKREIARTLKEKRRREQDANISRKEKEKEENKQKSIGGMKRKAASEDVNENKHTDDVDIGDEHDEEEGEEVNQERENSNDIEDDDAEYYRQEVGDEPDEDLLHSMAKKRKQSNYEPKFHNKKIKKIGNKRFDEKNPHNSQQSDSREKKFKGNNKHPYKGDKGNEKNKPRGHLKKKGTSKTISSRLAKHKQKKKLNNRK